MTCANPNCPCHQWEEAALPVGSVRTSGPEPGADGQVLTPLGWEFPTGADEEADFDRKAEAAAMREFDTGAPTGANEEADFAAMREFDTGATRNLDVDPDIYGFTSPLALGLFAEYMHENRTQADGTLRDSDNWKKGIPLDSYVRSMRRHMQDLTLHHDGYGHLAREDLFAALGGLFFNIQGYMHEVVKAGMEEQRNQALEGLLELFSKPTVFVYPEADAADIEPLTITAEDGGEEEIE